MLSPTETAFSHPQGLAVADASSMVRYEQPFAHLAGGSGRAAGADDEQIFLLHAAQRALTSYPLPDALALAFDAQGALYVETAEGLYQEAAEGRFVLRYASPARSLHGLAASGPRLWFIDGAELGTIEGNAAYRTEGAGLPADGSLVGSDAGAVWMLREGELSRFATDQGMYDDKLAWQTTIKPVFLRDCSACHVAGGAAGIDLSTYPAWVAMRPQIRQQVVIDRSMPPNGDQIPEADRQAIDTWTAAEP
jgi:mono/diheme cytochrome c family protein